MKRCLLLQDFSCFGTVALVPQLSILSAMGIEVVPLPTALFTSHLALEGAKRCDTDAFLADGLAQYKALGLSFDALCTGFFPSAQMVEQVERAQRLCSPDALCLVDPVMGDGGKCYRYVNASFLQHMQTLCQRATHITPNCTEARLLLGHDPGKAVKTIQEGQALAESLARRYSVAVVLTGVREGDTVATLSYEAGQIITHTAPYLPTYFPGTGDVLTAVLLGGLLRGDDVHGSTRRAASFVSKTLQQTSKQGTNPLHGVRFETCLPDLVKTLDEATQKD